jgi:hypothetical protein
VIAGDTFTSYGRLTTSDKLRLPFPLASSATATALLDVVHAVLRRYSLSEDDAIHAARVVRSALHGFVSLETNAGFGIDLDLNDSFRLLVAVLDRGLRAPRPRRRAAAAQAPRLPRGRAVRSGARPSSATTRPRRAAGARAAALRILLCAACAALTRVDEAVGDGHHPR